MALEWKELDERLVALENRLASIEAKLSELAGPSPWMNMRQAARVPGDDPAVD